MPRVSRAAASVIGAAVRRSFASSNRYASVRPCTMTSRDCAETRIVRSMSRTKCPMSMAALSAISRCRVSIASMLSRYLKTSSSTALATRPPLTSSSAITNVRRRSRPDGAVTG